MVRTALTLLADVAAMVASVWLATTVVLTVNWPLLSPSGITMLPGTVAEPLLLERLTRTPPAGAGDVNVTVPVEGLPPVTVLGERVRLASWPGPGSAGLIVSAALTLLADVAVMVAIVALPTGVVLTVNWPLDEPSGMTILAGTVADALLLDRLTSTPPAGATAARVTVPVEGFPPVTVVGASVRLRS